MNQGKVFENAIKKSVPESVLLYRLPDSAQSFGGSSRLRFSRKNPFDFLMWDSDNRNLYALEMKTVKDKSISFERTSDDNGEIHRHQIIGLNEWSEYKGIICGFVIEFRKIETTVFIEIHDFNTLISSITKKSFTITDLDNNGIRYFIIPQKLMKTNYRYDISELINQTKNLTD